MPLELRLARREQGWKEETKARPEATTGAPTAARNATLAPGTTRARDAKPHKRARAAAERVWRARVAACGGCQTLPWRPAPDQRPRRRFFSQSHRRDAHGQTRRSWLGAAGEGATLSRLNSTGGGGGAASRCAPRRARRDAHAPKAASAGGGTETA